MNAKPKDAIERMREGQRWQSDISDILAWADSIPDDAVSVVWPAELTREWLETLANDRYLCQPNQVSSIFKCTDALRALAAIAPQKRKRVVNLWQHVADDLPVCRHPKWQPDPALACNWTLIKRNVELED